MLQEDSDYKLFHYIANNVINGLKHDGAIRDNIELTKELVDGMTLSFPITYELNENGEFQTVTIALHLWWITVKAKIDLHYGTGNDEFALGLISISTAWSDMGSPDIKAFIRKYRRLVYKEWGQVKSDTVVSDSRDD